MSWQLGAFGILGIALVGGFAWYERQQPPSRVVALVGTLAALGALGRIAFAALPNVKPTTDIVLISGFALGGPPGFVVGALAALTSNFFFGQGPWTPWQMAGWGAVGIIGAALGRLTGGRIGRVPLALVSFVVGFAFTALQDLGDWVTFSGHSLAQLTLYLGKGIGFDFVHATGCLLFALAFGPAMMSSLRRFRLRLSITWVTPVLVIVAVAALPGLARGATTPSSYLLGAQNRDGGFGPAPGQPSASIFSGWAALALAADGIDLAAVRRDGGPSLESYLEDHPGSDPGSIERSILALSAGSRSDRPAEAREAGRLLARLRADLRRDGSVAEQTNLSAFAVLAERAYGAPPPARQLSWLARQEDGDGGFNFATGSRSAPSDADDTGAALQALAGTGYWAVVDRAVAFLRRIQNRDGGFPSEPRGPSNAQSTAFAVQGLIAVGRLSNLRRSPLRYLRSLIGRDGHVDYARGQDLTPVWVTAQAELALLRRPLPIRFPRSAAVVPASHEPPARSPATELGSLAADVGVLQAMVLAPLGM